MWLLGPPNVEKLERKARIGGLIRATAYRQDPAIQVSAAQALARLGNAEAVGPLASVLADPEAEVRRSAAEALESLDWQPTRDEAGARFFVALERWDECVELGRAAREPLAEAVRARSDRPCAAAVAALARIGDGEALQSIIDDLLKSLTAKGDEQRLAAAEALGVTGSVKAIEPLKVACRDSSKRVRQAALTALGRIGSSALESHSDFSVRAEAARALGDLGDPRACGALARVLETTQPRRIRRVEETVVVEAARALGRLGDRGACRVLLEALEDRGGHESWRRRTARVRRAAAEALGQLGGPEAREGLLKALEDRRRGVRQAAVKALAHLGGPEALEGLVESLDAGVREAAVKALAGAREAAVKALAHQGGPEAREGLLRSLGDPDTGVREAAVKALAHQGGPEAREGLLRSLGDPDTGVREAAVTALAHKAGTEAREGLLRSLGDPDTGVRETAARALEDLGWRPGGDEAGARFHIARGGWDECIRIGPQAVQPLLEEALAHRSPEAVAALARIADPNAVSALSTAGRKGSDAVRRAAIAGLIEAGSREAALALRELSDELRRDFEGAVNRWTVFEKLVPLAAVEPEIVKLALSFEKPDLRRSALSTLMRTGIEDVVNAVAPELRAMDAAEAESCARITALIDRLQGGRGRRAAAKELVELYRGGKLTSQARNMILAHRFEIQEPHRDRIQGHDDEVECTGQHSDKVRHQDVGMGFRL